MDAGAQQSVSFVLHTILRPWGCTTPSVSPPRPLLSETLSEIHPKVPLGILGDSKSCKFDDGDEAPQTGHPGLLQNVVQFYILKTPSKSVILWLFVPFLHLG